MLEILKSMESKVDDQSKQHENFQNEIDQLLEASLERDVRDVTSSSSVRRLESKDNNLMKRVLPNTNSKTTSKDVKNSQSSVSLASNKCDTLNSNVSTSKANVLNAKTINVMNDGSNLICVARYALSMNSRVKRALFTSLVVAKSSKLEATPLVAKSSHHEWYTLVDSFKEHYGFGEVESSLIAFHSKLNILYPVLDHYSSD
ncbi:hypothetical protein Tco_0610938 [Tanacetum coccineum]